MSSDDELAAVVDRRRGEPVTANRDLAELARTLAAKAVNGSLERPSRGPSIEDDPGGYLHDLILDTEFETDEEMTAAELAAAVFAKISPVDYGMLLRAVLEEHAPQVVNDYLDYLDEEDDQEHDSCPCADCGALTLPPWTPETADSYGSEFYVVLDDIWEAADAPERGYLCIGCLERRLGRELDSADFADVPLNSFDAQYSQKAFWHRSARLADRLTRGGRP